MRDQYDALALELRAPNGVVIPTEDIQVTDTEFLLAIDRERDEEEKSSTEDAMDGGLDPDFLADLVDQLAESLAEPPPWLPEVPEHPPARFQLAVTLAGKRLPGRDV